MEEQDDKTVTEWMRKQVRSPTLQITISCAADMRQAGRLVKGGGLGLQAMPCHWPVLFDALLSNCHWSLLQTPINTYSGCWLEPAWQPIETSCAA